jgi:putative FmdB family regulatory protein
MPVFDFDCPKGHRHEELFLHGESILDEAKCPCGETSHRRVVNRFRIHGPVWSNTDALSDTYGKEIKSQKDIEAWEQKHRLARLSAYEAKVAREDEGHISARITKTARESGTQAACRVVEEVNMCEGMGWTPTQFNAWKEQDDHGKRIAADIGAFPGGSTGTG